MFEKIKKIKKIGFEESYDIEMNNVSFQCKPTLSKSNFIANGIVCKNSGGDARSSLTILDTFQEFPQAKEFAKKYPEAVDIAIHLEGAIRHRGVHAGAMITTERNVASYAPVFRVNGTYVVEWEKQLAEDMKLIKFDILGLSTLTIIQDCIKETDIVLPENFDDKNIYENIFHKGDTLGVFQFLSTGMTKFVEELKPDNFNELYDASSLFRPSALHAGQSATYCNRKLGKEPIEYFHPLLEPITKKTKGIIIYQEQIMQIMYQVGCMSWATAEMARKVITKSKGKDAFNKMRKEFVNNANKIHKMPREEAERIYDLVSTFGCLTGDTKIYRCSANQHKGVELSIKEAYEYQDNDNFKHRKLKVLSMHADGRVRFNTIKKIYDTGKKEVYYIKTDSNKEIKASKNHVFLVNDKWIKVSEIKTGNYIKVTDRALPKRIYGKGIGSGNHTSDPRLKKGKGKTNEKKMQKEKLMQKYNSSCQICGSKKFVEMHHINKDHSDNSDKNTMLLCRKHHRQEEKNINFARFQEGYCTYNEKIIEIKRGSVRQTFDIEMEGEPRNFIANDFVSHNSYGFCQIHAVEYSILSYYCAWLKYYHPQRFYNAILKHEKKDAIIYDAMQEAEKKGIKINYPDINKSDFSYSIKGNEIFAGLNSINGLGEKTALKIMKNRPYVSVEDFQKKCKVSKKIFSGLIIADTFRDFDINKQAWFLNKQDIDEDFGELEWTKLIYGHTVLQPKISVLETFDFGEKNYIDIKDFGEENANQQVLARGIVTDVINKDKLIRANMSNHVHSFEKHMFYLNLNDGTGNIAVQISPITYEKYSELINRIDKKPLIVMGNTDAGGKKIYCDLLQELDGEKDIDNFFELSKDCDSDVALLASSQPAVSKKGNSYYRVALSDGTKGLVFKPPCKLYAGMKIKYTFSDPFINVIKAKEVM